VTWKKLLANKQVQNHRTSKGDLDNMRALIARELADAARSALEETAHVNSPLAQDGPKGSFRDVSSVVWNRHLPSGLSLAPYLMAAGAWSVKFETEHAKPTHSFAVGKSCQTAHQEIGTGTRNS
jgi:hypothetical protein